MFTWVSLQGWETFVDLSHRLNILMSTGQCLLTLVDMMPLPFLRSKENKQFSRASNWLLCSMC